MTCSTRSLFNILSKIRKQTAQMTSGQAKQISTKTRPKGPLVINLHIQMIVMIYKWYIYSFKLPCLLYWWLYQRDVDKIYKVKTQFSLIDFKLLLLVIRRVKGFKLAVVQVPQFLYSFLFKFWTFNISYWHFIDDYVRSLSESRIHSKNESLILN